MPQIDITSPVVAGLNAASGAVGGAVQGFLQGRASEQAAQARLDDAEYRDHLLRARLKEMEATARERRYMRGERERAGRREDRSLDLREREIDERYDLRRQDRRDLELGADYVARITESMFGSSKVEEFEADLGRQRANAVRFAAGLSPSARALVMAGVDDDERAERAAMARRAARAAWEGVLTNPSLGQDASPMADEIRALAMEEIEALESGEESPAKSLRDLDDLRERVSEFSTKQRSFQWGLGWADQQIQEGGADIEGMQRALSDFESMGPSQANLTDLKKAVLRAKHGVDLDEVKFGKVSVPRSVRPGSREWMQIASSAADEEVVELMAREPLLKQKVADGDFDDDMDGYMQIREEFRRGVMRRYAAQSGLSMGQMRALGLMEDPKRVQQRAEDEIREALKSAGIDPDMRIPSRPAPVRPEQRRREPIPQAPERYRQSELNLGPTGQLKVFPPLPPSEDGVYDERDIDEVYGDDG